MKSIQPPARNAWNFSHQINMMWHDLLPYIYKNRKPNESNKTFLSALGISETTGLWALRLNTDIRQARKNECDIQLRGQVCVFKQEKVSGGKGEERNIGTDKDKETKKDRESDEEMEKRETKIKMNRY